MTAAPKRVFIVDDEVDIRELLTHALESAGFAVVPISSGIDLMKCLREQRPDNQKRK